MSKAFPATMSADDPNIMRSIDTGVSDPAPKPRPAPPPGRQVPPMPRIGLPEETYLHVAHRAERDGDTLVFEAAKVGQYVSLALRDPDAPWGTKLRYFRHALKRHCTPPENADPPTKAWFERLAKLVRTQAGTEALRLSAEVDEMYQARKSLGQDVEKIADDAEKFFDQIAPMIETCPPVYTEEDWAKLKAIRDRWI